MPGYFVQITPRGPIRYGQFPYAIGVLEAPDRYMPIGMAFEVGNAPDRLARWRHIVHGADVSGRGEDEREEPRQVRHGASGRGGGVSPGGDCP